MPVETPFDAESEAHRSRRIKNFRKRFFEGVRKAHNQSTLTCLFTGATSAIAAHIIPANQELNMHVNYRRAGYTFRDVWRPRNGIPLLKALDDKWQDNKLTFMCTPLHDGKLTCVVLDGKLMNKDIAGAPPASSMPPSSSSLPSSSPSSPAPLKYRDIHMKEVSVAVRPYRRALSIRAKQNLRFAVEKKWIDRPATPQLVPALLLVLLLVLAPLVLVAEANASRQSDPASWTERKRALTPTSTGSRETRTTA